MVGGQWFPVRTSCGGRWSVAKFYLPDSIRQLDSESNQSSQKGSENEVKVVFTACSEYQ